MKIADGLEMLEIAADFGGRQVSAHPTLVWDSARSILIDTGFPGMLPKIGAALDRAGVPLDKLNMIIITHQDIDHIGCLAGIIGAAHHKIEVLAHETEKPYIQGEKRMLKSSPENLKRFDALPAEQRERMKAVFANPPKGPVDRTVADGAELPYCGGIIVVATPGHTPGHICLYLKKYKALVAGDAMNLVEDKLTGPNPQNAWDHNLAVDSLKKLATYDIEKIICYHGGLYQGRANERIAELAAGR